MVIAARGGRVRRRASRATLTISCRLARQGAWSPGGLEIRRSDLSVAVIASLTGGALVLLAMGARMLWQALKDRRRTLDGAAPPPGTRPFTSMFLVTLANPLTILLFYGYATAAAGAHRHWLLGAMCVFAGSLVGQLVFAFGGSAIGRIVKSPRWLVASHVLAALVVLGYGVAGMLRV